MPKKSPAAALSTALTTKIGTYFRINPEAIILGGSFIALMNRKNRDEQVWLVVKPPKNFLPITDDRSVFVLPLSQHGEPLTPNQKNLVRLLPEEAEALIERKIWIPA